MIRLGEGEMTKEEFYHTKSLHGEARIMSREVDFGVHWRDDGHEWRRYRVTWVQNTGEVYAMHLDFGSRQEVYRVLGVVYDEDELEHRMEGWADVCMRAGDLQWVIDNMPERKVQAWFGFDGLRHDACQFCGRFVGEPHDEALHAQRLP